MDQLKSADYEKTFPIRMLGIGDVGIYFLYEGSRNG